MTECTLLQKKELESGNTIIFRVFIITENPFAEVNGFFYFLKLKVFISRTILLNIPA